MINGVNKYLILHKIFFFQLLGCPEINARFDIFIKLPTPIDIIIYLCLMFYFIVWMSSFLVQLFSKCFFIYVTCHCLESNQSSLY